MKPHGSRHMIFTSESVTPGHPDKLCDQISDAAIDHFLRHDPGAHAVIECAVATGIVFLAARFAANVTIDLSALARKVIADVGYRDSRFNARDCSILTSLTELPPETREPPLAVPDDEAIDRYVARDQANVFGYACRDTPELMPLPISLAHHLARALDQARQSSMKWLLPDAKTQVAVEYCDSRPARIQGITLTAGVEPNRPSAHIREHLRALATHVLAAYDFRLDSAEVHINTDGLYDVGGPARHAGLTGRKNGIDTYGEIARQSGAALSGKDPSRIDRIGAYAARHAAKNIVAAGLAERCEVHLAYAIGQPGPLSVSVETFGTGQKRDDAIARRLGAVLDFRPAAIVHRFGLRTRPMISDERGFYRPLAVFGHFGRPELDLPWEKTEIADALRD